MTDKKTKGSKKAKRAPEELNLYTALAVFLVGLFNASLVMLTGLLKFLRKDGSSFVGRLLVLLFFGYLYLFLAERRPAMYTALFIAWVVGCFVIAGVQAYGDARAPKKRKKAKKSKKKDTKREEDGHGEANLQEDAVEGHAGNDHENDPGERSEEEDEAARHQAALRALKDYVRHVVEAGAAGKLTGPNKEGKIVPVTGRGARLDDILHGLRSHVAGWTRGDLKERLAECGIRYKEQMYFKVGGKKDNVPGINVVELREDLGLNPRQAPPDQVPDNTPTTHSPAPTSPLTLVSTGEGHEGGDEGAA